MRQDVLFLSTNDFRLRKRRTHILKGKKMRKSNASRTWLLTLVILLPSQLAAGNSKPDLDHLRVPDSYDIHPQIYFCVNYMDGQKFWAVRVERRDYKLSNDEMIYNYEIYRYIENWVVLDINSQLVCDGSVCRDIALAADGAHRIWVGQDDPIPASGGIPLYMWSPQALDAKADEWWLIADLADWMDIFQAVGDISAGTVTAFLLGPVSELQKLTVREALKVTATELLKEARDYVEARWTVENAYKQTLKDRARAAAESLRVHADKDIRIELGSCVDFSEIIAFRDGVSDIQARGEGACRGLYEFYKGGLAQYLISVIEEADPTKFLELIDEIVDAIAGNPDLAAAMDAVEYWEAIAVMRREGTLDGALDVMQAFCNANQEPKLLAYWNFDEGSGSIASDSSGNGNDGTIYGAAWTAGRIGYALGFDGSNDWVDIPDDISPEYITLGAWIYPTGFDDGPGDQGNAIIQRSTGGAGAPGDRSWSWRLRIMPRSHLAQFQAAGPNTGVPSVVAPTALVQNRWYHLAATYDGNVMKIYVDGELKATNSNLDGPLETYNLIPVAIGCLEGWGLQHFQGIIDEVRIYNQALSESDIGDLASETQEPTDIEKFNLCSADLVCLYNFGAAMPYIGWAAEAASVACDIKQIRELKEEGYEKIALAKEKLLAINFTLVLLEVVGDPVHDLILGGISCIEAKIWEILKDCDDINWECIKQKWPELVEEFLIVPRPILAIIIRSPVDIRIIDTQGNVMELNTEGYTNNGLSSPGWIFKGPNHQELAIILEADDEYLFEVVGTEGGTYGLDIVSVSGGEEITFEAAEIPTSPGARHVYAVDWQALSAGEEGVILNIDNDGDGVFVQMVIADNDLSYDEFALQTETVVDFDPDTLNLKSQGKFATVYIELPDDFDVSEIDLFSLALNELIPPLPKPIEIGDYDSDGINDLMVKFDLQELIEVLEPGEQIIDLTGRLLDGRPLAGFDFIRVIH